MNSGYILKVELTGSEDNRMCVVIIKRELSWTNPRFWHEKRKKKKNNSTLLIKALNQNQEKQELQVSRASFADQSSHGKDSVGLLRAPSLEMYSFTRGAK